MSIYKREGSEFWWLRYRGASGKLMRRSSGTKDEKVARAMLAQAEAEVEAEKHAKLGQAATGLGQHDAGDQHLPERVQQLEGAVRRLIRLHVGEFELRRQWMEDELSLRRIDEGPEAD